MGKTYRPWNPNQEYLLPPSIQDWLPEKDLFYLLLDAISDFDKSAITQKYEREKRSFPPFHPHMTVALLLYYYCRGIFSSRKIMQACQEHISFKVIVGDNIPNFRTISDFRQLHLEELQQLFVQVLQLCQEARQREQKDFENDDKSKRGRKRKVISEVPTNSKQYSFTNPESSIMKANNKDWDQFGNAQALVDSEGQIIVACGVTNESNDKQQFEPMLEQDQENVGEDKKIIAASADSSYYSESNVKLAEDKDIDTYIAVKRISTMTL